MRVCNRVLLIGVIIGALVQVAAQGAEFARIEGIHYHAGKPAPGKIHLEYQTEDGRTDGYADVMAGLDGKFVFEKVNPREVKLGRFVEYVQVNAGVEWSSWTSSHTQILFPKAGETLHVELGKGGWTIKGRMVAPENAKIDVGWQAGSSRYLYSTEHDDAVPPEGLTREEAMAWRKARYNSEEAKAIRGRQHMYVVNVEKDGRFDVSDVLPGEYSLYVEVGDATKKRKEVGPLGTGMVTHPVTAPEGEGGEINVGEVTAKLYDQLAPGDIAPDFTVTTLEGKSMSLNDFSGKFLLLDFWATWCGPCVGEMPNMKALYERFGANPKFVMLGMSVDNKRDNLIAFVEKEGLKWTQGYLGPWSETDVLDNYGVRGIPSVFLISPDGKIVAKNLHGERTVAAVAKALSE